MEDFIQKTKRQSTYCMHAQLLQSGHTLCDPMDCSPPGSSVHGILQARILEWVATPSSRTSSQARGQTHNSYVSCICKRVLYRQYHLGSPTRLILLHKQSKCTSNRIRAHKEFLLKENTM